MAKRRKNLKVCKFADFDELKFASQLRKKALKALQNSNKELGQKIYENEERIIKLAKILANIMQKAEDEANSGKTGLTVSIARLTNPTCFLRRGDSSVNGGQDLILIREVLHRFGFKTEIFRDYNCKADSYYRCLVVSWE